MFFVVFMKQRINNKVAYILILMFFGIGLYTASFLWRSSLDYPLSQLAAIGGYSVPSGYLTGEYFTGSNFDALKYTRTDSRIYFGWGETESPVPGIVPVDYFSVRWAGDWNFPTAGTYRFIVNTDEKFRLWFDDKLIHDAWDTRPRTTYYYDNISVSAGTHRIRAEYSKVPGFGSEVYLDIFLQQAVPVAGASVTSTAVTATPTSTPSVSTTSPPNPLMPAITASSTSQISSQATTTTSFVGEKLPVSAPSTKFIIRDSVKVSSGSTAASLNLNVRSAPSVYASILGTQSSISGTGKVVGGPQYADGYWWWKIDYVSGADGWSIENYLTKITTSTVIPSVPIPTSTPTSISAGWNELTSTKLRNVLAPAPAGAPAGSWWNPLNIIKGYSGGVLDTARNRLIIWGGGHADYPGNELYAIELAPTPRAVRLTDPSLYTLDTVEQLADGGPSSRHTYSCLVYLPDQDALWSYGGSLWRGGWPSQGTWMYYFSSGKWARKADHPGIGSAAQSRVCVSDWDPVMKRVVVQTEKVLSTYDPATDTWIKRGSGSGGENERTGKIVGRKLYIVGWTRSNPPPAGTIRAIDLNTFTESAILTTGATEITTKVAPGLDLDQETGELVAWAGGSDIYRLNLSTLVWTKTTMTGVLPGPAYWEGTYGRFRYVPALKSFVGVSSIDQNAYLLTKTSVSTPTSTPTPTPTSTSTNISLRTWTFLPYAPYAALNKYGTSKTLSHYDKHSSLATDGNGITYITGGDYYGASYRQETWALDIKARLSNRADPTAGWSIAYPYCGAAGAPQPKAPDHVGWTWVPRLARFLMVPGELVVHSTGLEPCPGETFDEQDNDGTLVGGPILLNQKNIMAFDPVARRWEKFRNMPAEDDGRNTWWAVYDAETDTVIKGASGERVGVFNLTSYTWQFFTPSGWPFSGGVWSKAHAAIDTVGRRVFLVDADRGRLLKWDIDAKRMVDLGSIPPGEQINTDGSRGYAVWDSRVKALIVMHYDPSKGVYLYHPDEPTPRWEKINYPTEGHAGPVHWRSAVYDAMNNVTIALGVADGGNSPGLWVLRLAD